MKKSVLLAAGVCLLSGMTAFADPVTSVNAVGVTKLNLPAGLSLIACPFHAVGGEALTLDQMFGSNLPYGSLVYAYVPDSGYAEYLYADAWYDKDFGPAGTTKIFRGEGFWILLPSVVTNLSLAGEVPGAAVGTNKIDLVGLQLVSFAFPQQLSVNDSGLVPHYGDLIYKFLDGDYVEYLYIDGMGWLDKDFTPVDVILNPNEAFWYISNTSGTNTWNQVKTYQWP